jgi:hypothetical protein
MADYTINCQANSLLEYTPDPPQLFRRVVSFFTVDFTLDEISKLITDFKGGKAAGICLVSGYEDILPGPLVSKRERVYAFRVEWNDENLVRNPDLDSNQIVSATVAAMILANAAVDFPDRDSNTFSVIDDGSITWTQNEIEKYKPDMPPFFTFFDVYTLRRLLAEQGCTHLRFRKALVKTKTKKPLTQDGEELNFLNMIVESVPTLVDKANNLAIQPNVITDEDAVAHDYGYACPPKWIPATNNIQKGAGYGIVKRSQTIRVANGVSISIGDVVDGIFNNVKAKNLLKNWKIYTEPKVLRIFNDGKRVVLV